MNDEWGECVGVTCVSIWDPINQTITTGDSDQINRGLARSLSSVFSPNLSTAVSIRGSPDPTSRRPGPTQDVRLLKQASALRTPGNLTDATHPYYIQIRDILILHNLVPVYSNLAVGCCDLRLATCLDLLCRDATGNLVVVLFKYGYGNYYEVQNQGYMQAPFEAIPVSFVNRHLIELLVSIWLFNHNCPLLIPEKINSGRVIRVYKNDQNELTAELTELPAGWVDDSVKRRTCLHTLRLFKSQTSKDRARILTHGIARSKYQHARSRTLQARSLRKQTMVPTS
jgi:hypothetical protein